MNITITINTDNAAFEGSPRREVKRILTEFMQKSMTQSTLTDGTDLSLFDINGNKVGSFKVEE